MIVHIPSFQGMVTALAPRLLSAEQGEFAENCVFRTGNLAPAKGRSVVPDGTFASQNFVSGAESLYLYEDDFWFSWDKDVNAVPSPINEDPHKRVYFTGDGVPKYTNSSIATGAGTLPFSSYELGLPSPAVPIVTVNYHDQSEDLDDGDDVSSYDTEPQSGFINIETLDDVTRFYVCTYVSAYGEESAPGTVSDAVELFSDSDVPSLSFGDTGGFGNVNITTRRIYRTASSSDSTSFYLCGEIPVTNGNFTDTLTDAELGAELSTQDYDKPPEDMQGIILTSFGVVVGYTGNTIVPSEAALPYAYPVAYRQSVPDTIMGLAETAGGIVIVTDNKPAIMTGAMPDAFTITVLDAPYPCVSKHSIVDMGESVMYASHEGLVSVSQSGAKLLSQPFLSREYWQSLKPSTMKAYRASDYYIAFFDNSRGCMVDMRSGDFVELDFYADAAYFDGPTGELYVLESGQLKTMNSGAGLTLTWRSKVFDIRGKSLTIGKILTQSPGNLSVSVVVDGVQLMAVPLTGVDPIFRLPAFRGDRMQFEVTGTGEIESIILASGAEELRSVQL